MSNNLYSHNLAIKLTKNTPINSKWIVDTRTRNTTSLLLPSPRSNYGKFALSFCGPWLWNQLPEKIRSACSADIFKKRSKEHFSEHDFRSLIAWVVCMVCICPAYFYDDWWLFFSNCLIFCLDWWFIYIVVICTFS